MDVTPDPWFTTDHCLWDVMARRSDGLGDQCVYAAYLDRDVAWRELNRLRADHPLTTFYLRVSDFRLTGRP